MSKTRVLIVDDCVVVRDGLQSLLKGCPCIEVVGEAGGGREAVIKAEKLQPNVVLMDAQMPGLDGTGATRQIKERWPHIKVLFLTVHSSYIDRGIAAGADGHLMKDCTRQELLGAIREVSGQKLSKCV
jgi:DNA-binding NarL/FixJ family response regulator